MKKLLLTLLLVAFVSCFAVAQTSAGSKLIGGSGTLHINIEGDERDPSFVVLSPRFGFFVSDKLALGTAIPVLVSASSVAVNSAFGLTPFVRLYGGSSVNRMLLEVRAGYNYSIYKNKETDVSVTEGYLSYGVGAGYVHFVNEHVGLELMLSYDKSDESMPNIEYSHLNGINLNIGLQIYLLPRKE
ncbi:porin family protein [Cesiribacter sp. SM1]|uniref:porin family protein n=1 Tax=Cesiribacter sp. SM1 TaxID=2861196 RepID=UPI001CD3B849|nr:porin family protein [Cesiribacter sp. SM1]